MASLNLVQLIGNMGKDPEMRYTPSGQAVTQFSVAVNRNFRRDNEWQSETEWFRVVVWGDQAERVAEHRRKGDQVYVQGRLQTRSWEDSNTGTKRYSTELIADKVTALGKREDRDGDAPAERGGSRQAEATTQAAADDYEDLPF